VPDIRSHSLVTLTLVKLYLAPAGGAVRPETIQAIQNGADLDATFGPLGTVIDLQNVTKVRLDLLTNTLVIEYRANGRSAARVAIECLTHETADDIYTKVWRRLGERFEVKADKKDPWELARGPVVVMAAILLLTPVLALGSNVAADGRPDPTQYFGLMRIFAWVDWKVICGVGGGLLALLQLWLYRRLTNPPSRLELVPNFDLEIGRPALGTVGQVNAIAP